MNKLEKHVDNLFRTYPKNSNVLELKEEILGNLEAKVAHLQSEGWDEQTAIRKATRDMSQVENLIDEHVTVKINEFRLQALQIAFIYLLVAWIVTIPFSILRSGMLFQYTLFAIVLMFGIIYVGVSASLKNDLGKMARLNYVSIYKAGKVIWLIWGLFIVVTWGYVTATLFASNLWFSRPIHIDGPYQFAVILSRYVPLFVTIVIPLAYRSIVKRIPKTETEDGYE